jgi:hypothetical protein
LRSMPQVSMSWSNAARSLLTDRRRFFNCFPGPH